MANYSASARFPTRPLSYENRHLAENKEVIVDYDEGLIYIKTVDGDIVDITESITDIVIENITTNPEYSITADSITITVDGVEYTLQLAFSNLLEKVEKMGENLGVVVDPDTGEITMTIKASDIETDSTHRFVTDAEKVTFNAKSKITNYTATILGGASKWSGSAAPYTQSVAITNMLESDIPIVDIDLNCTYEEANTRMDNFAYIYRIRTLNGQIQAFASKVPEVNLPIVLKIDRAN